METWKELIIECLLKNKIDEQIEFNTLTEEELNRKFDSDFGCEEGVPFTAWTKNYVLFPVKYDGCGWVDFVPRNPCDFKKDYAGGG